MGRIDGPGGCLGFGGKADGSLGGSQESSGHLADLVSSLVGCVIAIFHHLKGLGFQFIFCNHLCNGFGSICYSTGNAKDASTVTFQQSVISIQSGGGQINSMMHTAFEDVGAQLCVLVKPEHWGAFVSACR